MELTILILLLPFFSFLILGIGDAIINCLAIITNLKACI